MSWLLLAAVVALGGPAGAAQSSAKLTTLRAVHDLAREQVAQQLPAEFQATVTYNQRSSRVLFVQDGDRGLSVQTPPGVGFLPGDRVVIRGVTQPSVHPFIQASSIVLLRPGVVPKPIPATFNDLLTGRYQCLRVAVRGRVLTADPIFPGKSAVTHMRLNLDGDRLTAEVLGDDSERLKTLLDAQVEVVGVASGRFDGKKRQLAALVHVSSADDVRLVKPAAVAPWQQGFLSISEVMKSYHVKDFTERVRVRGVVTYYQPGHSLVLKNQGESLLVTSQIIAPLQIGETVEASGFPNIVHGQVSLMNAELRPLGKVDPVAPEPSTWRDLAATRHIYDLVSIEGQVVSAVRDISRDEYILSAEGGMFSVFLRHPDPSSQLPLPPMKEVPQGARVRVTGICVLDDDRPFEQAVPFSILMRSSGDLVVVAKPSWLNTRALTLIVGLLAVIVVASAVWGWILTRRVHEKSLALARRIESDAAFERRMNQLEARRSRILEDINGSASLASILEEITGLVSLHLDGATCWCEIMEGARLGHSLAGPENYRIAALDIPARVGPPLGRIFAAFPRDSQPRSGEQEGLAVGVRVATLAIETRRVYSDLRRRSEYDLLTDVPNRFLLNHHLDKLIEEARQEAHIFGLIYIDLDDFKQINDVCGHQVGDLYLQEVTRRMKRQLRGRDVLARIGGDEFAVLVPAVRGRAEVDEIALRLERCFDGEIVLDCCRLSGSASVGIALYPEDAASADGLLSAADAAMYVTKHTRRSLQREGGSRTRAEVVGMQKG